MDGLNPEGTARLLGQPIHSMLVPFPIAFFIGAFLTDLVFLRTDDDFSEPNET